MKTQVGLLAGFGAVASLLVAASNGKADPPWANGGGNINNIIIGINLGGACCCGMHDAMATPVGGQPAPMAGGVQPGPVQAGVPANGGGQAGAGLVGNQPAAQLPVGDQARGKGTAQGKGKGAQNNQGAAQHAKGKGAAQAQGKGKAGHGAVAIGARGANARPQAAMSKGRGAGGHAAGMVGSKGAKGKGKKA